MTNYPPTSVIRAKAGIHLSIKSGLSLMELILSIALLSILSTFIVTHMISAWNASEKNITNIHCAITANNIYEGLLADNTVYTPGQFPVVEFLSKLPVTTTGELTKNSIWQAAGTGRIAVWKEKISPYTKSVRTGLATYTIIVAEPSSQSGDAFRASFRLNFFVHNPPHPPHL